MDYYREDIHATDLPSGIRVVSEFLPGVESVALGVWADTGSVDDLPGKFGAAHFLEHMLFKGTARRNAFQLAETIEDVGGQINAYTERETTHIYTRVLADHLPVAVDLLADMVCRSTFPEEEIERERQVIIEEIRKYESLPEERIHDLFMTALWSGGDLGHAILGDEISVSHLTREDLIHVWQTHFAANRLLITAAGKVQHESLVSLIQHAFSEISPGPPKVALPNNGSQIPRLIAKEDEEQINFCWGGRAYPAHDERNFALALIDAALGASSTSRLFQEIREKRGLAYDVSSYTMAFRSTGLVCATGACNPAVFPEVLSLIRESVESLCTLSLTGKEFARAKEQIKADLALSMESTTERMSRLALHHFTWGSVIPLPELMERINRVTFEDIQQVLNEVLDIHQWSFVGIGAIEDSLINSALG